MYTASLLCTQQYCVPNSVVYTAVQPTHDVDSSSSPCLACSDLTACSVWLRPNSFGSWRWCSYGRSLVVLTTVGWRSSDCLLLPACRHHVLSQWVALCLTSMASLHTRTALLAKFIEVARALQGTGYTDIFGFMSLMTGLNSVQVMDCNLQRVHKTWRCSNLCLGIMRGDSLGCTNAGS